MAPPRLVSLFKNQVGSQKREQWHQELPLASDLSESSSGLKVGHDAVYAKAPSTGTFVVLNVASQGAKHAQKPPTFSVGARPIVDFDASPIAPGTLACASNDEILVGHVATDADVLQWTQKAAWKSKTTKVVKWHPSASDILLSTAPDAVTVWDVTRSLAAFTLPQTQLCDASFSHDGRFIGTTSKGFVHIWDPRAEGNEAVQEATGHQGIKPSHVAWTQHHLVTVGCNKMRDREVLVYDPRQFGKPLKTQRLDSNMGTVFPLVDVSRNMVHLAGRGDMSFRWIEVDGSATLTEGNVTLPVPIYGAAIAPPSTLDVMQAEINKIYISTKDGNIVPVTMSVPRRQYLDFHAELYPPVPTNVPCCSAKQWSDGDTADVAFVEVTSRGPNYTQSALPATAKSVPATTETVPTPKENVSTPTETVSRTEKTHIVTPAPVTVAKEENVPVTTPKPQSQSPSQAADVPTPTPSTSSPNVTKQVQVAENAAPKPASPFKPTLTSTNTLPRYSRNFLVGKTPLKPAYEGLANIATTTPPDMQLLRATPSFLYFPLSGAGGRLAAHPVNATGRFPNPLKALVSGASITCFEPDPFDHATVYVGGDDGKIRVFRATEDVLQADRSDAERILSDTSMDHVTELCPHPTASGLLLSVSSDRGNPTLRLWDSKTGTLLKKVPVDCPQIFATSWSPDGQFLALACKDKRIHVLDIRKETTVLQTAAHDSPRLMRVCWAGNDKLVTTGFSKSASRQVKIYALSLEKQTLECISTLNLDVSPAPFFPLFDLDTMILFLYGKGENTIHAFDLEVSDTKVQLNKLPPYQTGSLQLGFSFLPKRCVDETQVEVRVGFKMTNNTIERVTFSIPRARVEFFQDDVYPPTLDVETSSTMAEAWLQGANTPLNPLDLNRTSKPLLSQAPPTKAQMSTRHKIAAGPQLTESQKADAYLSRLFDKAKVDGSDSESDDEPRPLHSQEMDDDW